MTYSSRFWWSGHPVNPWDTLFAITTDRNPVESSEKKHTWRVSPSEFISKASEPEFQRRWTSWPFHDGGMLTVTYVDAVQLNAMKRWIQIRVCERVKEITLNQWVDQVGPKLCPTAVGSNGWPRTSWNRSDFQCRSAGSDQCWRPRRMKKKLCKWVTIHLLVKVCLNIII